MKKKFLSLLLALAMCLSLSVPAWAAAIESEPSIEPNGPQYHYKSVSLPRQDKVYLTKPDNQDPEGTYFTRGLSIHFTINNGTTLDKTVSVPLPHPFDKISVGISVGRQSAGVTEYSMQLPSNEPEGNYFLMLWKYYYVDPFVVYRKAAGAADIPANWEIDHVGHTLTYRYFRAELMTPAEAASALAEEDS